MIIMKKFLILFLFVVQFGFTDDLDIQISGNLKAILGSSQSTDWSVVSATDVLASNTVSAATFIFSASEIPLYVGDTTTSDSGKALIYDATTNSINLLPITDYLDFATVGSSLLFGDISDVSVEFASEGWVPAWNAASEIWEATPAATTSGSTGITESEVSTLIEDATTSLTFDEISNVSMTAKVDGVIPYWNAAESVWDATPQASGSTSTGGVSALADLTDVSLSSPTSGQVLGYNGSAWINTAAGGGASPATIVIAAANSLDTSGAHYICDGVSDEIEINAALGDLGTVGGSIYLKEGTYNIASPVSVTTSIAVRIYGAGWGTVLSRQWNGSSGNGMIESNNNSAEVFIDHLMFNGNSNTHVYSSNAGIYLRSAAFLRVDSVKFSKNGNGVREYASYDPVSITNSHFYDCIGSAIFSETAGNTVVAGNHIENCGSGIKVLKPNDRRSIITDNVIISCGSSATSYGISSNTNGIVSRNYIRNQTGRGIECSSGEDFVIENNVILYPSSYGIFVNTSMYITKIANNYVAYGGSYGIYLYYSSRNAYVVNNWVSECTSAGLRIDNCSVYDENYIFGNRLENNAYGIYYYKSSGKWSIKDNQIINSAGAGTFFSQPVSTSDIFMENNNISYNGGSAVGGYIYNGVANLHIEGNRMMSNASGPVVDVTKSSSFPAWETSTVKVLRNTYTPSYAPYDLLSTTLYDYNCVESGNIDPALAGTRILAASSGACIGFATDELTSIDHVITVAPNATTNPIATSWDTWSLPELKSGIAGVSEDKKRSSVGNIGALKLIEFDWKYNEAEPEIAKEDIGTATETIIRQGWEKRKAGWERQKNKVKSWSADITDPSFPAELGSYNAEGKLTGINNTAVIWRLVGAVQELQAEVERLKFGGKN
jgi:hypothetical protein